MKVYPSKGFFPLIIGVVLALESCVPSGKFKDLETKYYAGVYENTRLKEIEQKYHQVSAEKGHLEQKNNELKQGKEALLSQYSQSEERYTALEHRYAVLAKDNSEYLKNASKKVQETSELLKVMRDSLDGKELEIMELRKSLGLKEIRQIQDQSQQLTLETLSEDLNTYFKAQKLTLIQQEFQNQTLVLSMPYTVFFNAKGQLRKDAQPHLNAILGAIEQQKCSARLKGTCQKVEQIEAQHQQLGVLGKFFSTKLNTSFLGTEVDFFPLDKEGKKTDNPMIFIAIQYANQVN